MPDIFVAEDKKEISNEKIDPKIPEKRKINPAHLKRFVELFRQKKSHQDASTARVKIFSSFCENPTGISFEEKEEDEKVLLFLRRHFITNVPWIFLSLVFLSIPIVLRIINFQFSITDTFSFLNITTGFAVIFLLFYYSIIFTFIFVNFITWYFNISLITNKRVVDIDFSGLVYKDVSATKLTLLQDVSYKQTGVIRSIFNYGDVLVQTAGALENFDLSAVPHPERVVLIVEELIGKETHGIF